MCIQGTGSSNGSAASLAELYSAHCGSDCRAYRTPVQGPGRSSTGATSGRVLEPPPRDPLAGTHSPAAVRSSYNYVEATGHRLRLATGGAAIETPCIRINSCFSIQNITRGV